MAAEIENLRNAILNAAKIALEEMQVQMALESSDIIENFQWEWKGPISGSRPILDTGALRDSLETTPVVLNRNRMGFTLKWDPIDVDAFPRITHYASLVHDGATDYFETEDGTKDYTARPWTFLLMPADQRDESQINTKTGPSPSSLPEDYWQASLQSFRTTFSQQLSRFIKITGLPAVQETQASAGPSNADMMREMMQRNQDQIASMWQ
jgi:hypothetical protein